MTSSPAPRASTAGLRLAIVLGTTEETCTVVVDGRAHVVAYALPFPRPRADRVVPGNLVALAAASDGSDLIVWRWFDAVVVEQSGDAVAAWEPNHGPVVARPRNPSQAYRPGGRAYLSAGLPGAEWWVAGPAVDRAEEADVDLGEVEDFLTGHDLWHRLI
jgi:hypothetical protein